MRVISQDGTMDVPYEYYTIWRYKDQYLDVYHIACDCGETDYRRLADYSTEEKAIKAMEMLREKYLQYISLQGGESAFVQAVFQPNYWVLPKVFQFPQDDEIEV